MIEKQTHTCKGFTYIEVLVCITVIALMVGPLSYSYVTSVRTKESAIEIEEVTAYAERLLQETKEQINYDITQQQKALGGRILSPDLDTSYGVIQYLRDYDDVDFSSLTDGVSQRKINLDKLLSDFSATDYDTHKYAYEMVLWRVSDVDLSVESFSLDKHTLKKASCFYSDTDPDYQFLESNYQEGVNLVHFNIDPTMLKAFTDSELKYITNPTEENKKIKRLDLCTVDVKEDGTIETPIDGALAHMTLNIEEVKGAKDELLGYVITNRCEGFIEESGYTYRSVIDLDIRKILRKSDLEPLTEYDQFTFKFVNTTKYDQIIRIKQNIIKDSSEDNSETLEAINEKFNIVTTDEALGKSSILRINDEGPSENYLIAIIVRDKRPIQGHPGKIIKKILDVYSYEGSSS